MEGINMLAVLLGFLGVLVFGITSLVALGLLIACKTREARMTFAGGLLFTAIIAALAVLSFLEHGGGYDPGDTGGKLMIVLAALTLLLAGAGQFIAALRSPWTFAAALGCVAISMVLLQHAFRARDDLALAGDSLLLAGVSLMIALLSRFRSRLKVAAFPERERAERANEANWTRISSFRDHGPFGRPGNPSRSFGIKTTASAPAVDDRVECARSGTGVEDNFPLSGEEVGGPCGQAMRVPVVDGEDDNRGQLPEALPALPRAGLKSTSVLAPLVLPPRPPACWNVISVFAPFVGLLCAFLVGGLMAGGWDRMWWMAGLGVGFGLLSGLIALARGERLSGITALGLFVNLVPFLCLHRLFLY
jgi:hypothetical protein